MEKLSKYTILENDKVVEEIEAYSLLCGFVMGAKDSHMQGIASTSYGRASIGDHCTLIVAALQITKSMLEEANAPKEVIDIMLNKAITEGLL